MKQTLIVLIMILSLSGISFAQSSGGLTDDQSETMDQSVESNAAASGGTTLSLWSDPIFYQFDKMMPTLAKSLSRLNARITTVAVSDIDFSPSLTESFKKVATAKLFGQLLMENPRLKLIKCSECNMIRSEIKGGILTISRGLANQDERNKLAKKLGVEGFMTARIIEVERQLTVVINVYDAAEGRIILSDVVAGIPVPKNTNYNIFAGQVIFPMSGLTLDSGGTSLDHTGMLVGVEKTMRFSESWMLGASFAMYLDNNSKLESGHETLDLGFMFDGIVGWEFAFGNNSTAVTPVLGLGQFISTQFNFSVYQKYGIKVTIGRILTFNYYQYSYSDTNLDTPETGSTTPKLSGAASSIAFGFQF
ncbi:MAG: hypothetical protein GY786_00935 [Proteobacteria bacterium]|nr:hypothetical protein [Pseudomonadota bacterium]